jgi:membrane associated protein
MSADENILFIGHVGVLVPTSDGKLMFIEKLAFQEPFQAIKFDNRSQLNDYLMNKYDVEFDQPNARPFIMENDELLKGYRLNPNNKG